jgi:excinuclease UvrABC nuclease subunit
MNRELDRFLRGTREPDGEIKDLHDEESLDDIPKKAGAYIFVSDKKKFIYPNGDSQVIYIGMSKNIHSRIKKHHRISSRINSLSKRELLKDWHYNRYMYIRKFGCKVYWFTTRGTQSAKNLESSLMVMFHDKFHALPIGNGAFSYGD